MKVRDILETLLDGIENTENVEESAIASREGLILCSKCQKENYETVVAMSAVLYNAAETASLEIGKEIPDRVIVESVKGKIITTGAGDKAILIVITKPDIYLVSVLNQMDKTSEKINEVL